MNSIRRYLTVWLSLGILGISLFVIAMTLLSAKHEVDELYDANLKQISHTLRTQIEHNNLHEIRPKNWRIDKTKTMIDKEEDYLIQLWHKDESGHADLVYSSYPAIVFPLQPAEKIRSSIITGTDWRSFTAEMDDGWIQIAQPTHTRNVMLYDVLKNIILPLVLQLPLLAWLIWFTVRRSLRPLDDLSLAIRRREPNALIPLSMPSIPLEVQELVTALNNLLLQLNQAMQAQRRFTADAAHELRTPLAALQLQLDVLRMASSNDERHQAVDRLANGITRSIRLVQQLLTLTRLEPGQPIVESKQISLDQIVRQSMELHVPRSLAKKIDLGLLGKSSSLVYGNEDALLTLVNNLLDNAIHYTPEGGKVDVILHQQQEAGPSITVQDNGPGIPISDQPHVFDRFYRVLGTKSQGTGLGLSIVKAIADEYNATIQLISNEKGTAITVTFPAYQS
jgi:two-component system OmpR family sensor kinase